VEYPASRCWASKAGLGEHTSLHDVGSPQGLSCTLDLPYQAPKTGQIRPGLKVHELKADNRAVCGNSRREPMGDRGLGTVTCESCGRDTGRAN